MRTVGIFWNLLHTYRDPESISNLNRLPIKVENVRGYAT